MRRDRNGNPNAPPDFVAARDHVREELIRFARSLRRAGVDVPANAGPIAARALAEVGFDDEATARGALRATFVTDAEAIATFDRQFPEFWRRLEAGLDGEPTERHEDWPEGGLDPLGGDAADGKEAPDVGPDDEGEPASEDADPVSTALGAVVTGLDPDDKREREATEAAWYSPTGSRSAVEGAGLDPDLEAAFEAFGDALARLRGRRWDAGGDERADVRRALRRSFATGGTVLSVPRCSRTTTRRRAVWLVDVSRSVLDTVDRSFLLATLRRATDEWADTRSFFFDEEVREVSAAFDEPTAGAALAALERAETAWGGGTRIGDSVTELHERYPDAVDGRTVVFLVSDGLETGTVDALEREMAWLDRQAASVLWLNPLAASPEYEPTARGMATARPFVDGLFAFGGPADLAELARQLRRDGPGGRIGYEYDPRRGTTS